VLPPYVTVPYGLALEPLLDGVGIGAGTEEGCGSTWTEAAGTDEGWFDASVDLEIRGC
jgi:hypothetical protein